MHAHRWIVVADSPFLPARGGGEREHLGFVRAASDAKTLSLLVLPAVGTLDEQPYQEVLGGAPLLVSPRRTSPLLLAHPRQPYVVASRPAARDLVTNARSIAPDATGVVIFSYKSWRIGEALARGLGLPAVLRQHNLEGVYHRGLARETSGVRGLVLRVESMRISRDERLLEQAPWLTAVADISAHDAEYRRQRGGHAVHVPPFAFDTDLASLPRRPAAQRRVLFLGALDVATNTAAIEWLLDGPWPAIQSRVPEAALDVVGRRPSRALQSRLARARGVALHPDVPDIHTFLTTAAVAVNPAVAGSGVNIKLIDYLQAGLPVVSSSLGSRGLPLTAGVDLEIVDDPADFADAVVSLLDDPLRAESVGAAGRRRIASLLDPAANIRRLEATFN